MALLETKQLTKKFGGVHAVDHVDASFEPGTITALVGPNGSGKTTFINTVTGMLRLDSGTVAVGDISFTRVRPSAIAKLGMTRTFQSVRLISQMSVLDNILAVLTKRNVWHALIERHSKEHLAEAETILKKVGLWEKRDEPAERLSYGQRKLLEIARAVSMHANVYFFDEPFAGLFTEMTKIVSSILRELRDAGAAVVLVEHNMALIRDLCDRCYVLDSGKVIASGTPEQALAEEHVIQAYLGK